MPEALLLKYLVACFAILNPFANLVVFISMTGNRSLRQQHIIAFKTAISVGIILLVTTWFGDKILAFFGISVSSFELAGALVLTHVSLSMLQAHKTEISYTEAEKKAVEGKHAIAVVPLAIPIIAGPGTISTIIIYVHSNPLFINKVYFSFIDIALAIFFAILLYFAGPITKMIGNEGSNILTRIMGLIILAMAMEMLIHGLSSAFPSLFG